MADDVFAVDASQKTAKLLQTDAVDPDSEFGLKVRHAPGQALLTMSELEERYPDLAKKVKPSKAASTTSS